MTPQDHANHLLAVWQQRRHLPPKLRLPEREVKPPRLIQVGDHTPELCREVA